MRRTGPGLLGVLLLAAVAAAEAPWIQPIPDWVIDEDATLTVSVVVEDPDSDVLLYWVESDSPYLVVNFDEENMQVNCQPAAHWFGTAHVTVGVDDLNEARTLTTEEFRVDVLSVNDCPSRLAHMPPTPFAGPEDQCLELSWSQLNACFTDPDWIWEPGSLAYENPVFSAGTVETTATGLRLCPPADWNGNATLSVFATDGSCGVTSTLPIRIQAVNDCPVQVEAWEPIHGFEDTELVIGGLLDAFDDVDGDLLTFCILDNMGGFASRWNRSGVLTLTPPADLSGEWSLFICVTDGTCSTGAFLDIILEAVNDAPALPAITHLSLVEDGSLVVAYPVTDVDSPQVFVQTSSNNPGLAVAWNAAQGLQLLPAPDWNGQAVVTVTACDAPDGGGACATRGILVTVTAVNDAPVQPEAVALEMDEDGVLEWSWPITDVDGPELHVQVVSDQPDLLGSWSGGLLTLTALNDWNGQALLTVTACDGGQPEACVTRQLAVTVHAVNDAPYLAELVDVSFPEDGIWEQELDFHDIDSGELFVAVSSDQPELVAQWLDGRLRLLPAQDWHGQAQVTVVVSDEARRALAQGSFVATVLPVNDAPVLSGLNPVELPEDGELLLDLSVVDVDGPSLAVTVEGDTPGLTAQWIEVGNRLRLTPAADWNGTATLSLLACDLHPESPLCAAGQLVVHVLPVNDAPVLADPGPLSLLEDGELLVELAVVDVDGPELHLTVESDAAQLEATWLPESGHLRLLPAPDWHGQAILTLTACDLHPLDPLCDTLVVQVEVLAVNDAPSIGEIADQEMDEDGRLELPLLLSDVDDTELVLSWSVEPPVLDVQFDEVSALLELAPAPDWNGVCVVTLSLDDLQGRSVATRAFPLTVRPVNDAPHVMPCADWACGLVEDPAAFRDWLLQGGATADLADVDGDALELVWFVDGVEVSRHELGSAADTLECLVLPAPAEEWLTGHVVLHAELTDGTVSRNAGGEACAWELDFTGFSGTEPLRLALEPAWPNPFNPSTVLPFVLETAAEARLAIYDLRGAQVALLAEGWHAAGRHQVRWEAGRMASGVYLAVLETTGRRLVQRITLLK